MFCKLSYSQNLKFLKKPSFLPEEEGSLGPWMSSSEMHTPAPQISTHKMTLSFMSSCAAWNSATHSNAVCFWFLDIKPKDSPMRGEPSAANLNSQPQGPHFTSLIRHRVAKFRKQLWGRATWDDCWQIPRTPVEELDWQKYHFFIRGQSAFTRITYKSKARQENKKQNRKTMTWYTGFHLDFLNSAKGIPSLSLSTVFSTVLFSQGLGLIEI